MCQPTSSPGTFPNSADLCPRPLLFYFYSPGRSFCSEPSFRVVPFLSSRRRRRRGPGFVTCLPRGQFFNHAEGRRWIDKNKDKQNNNMRTAELGRGPSLFLSTGVFPAFIPLPFFFFPFRFHFPSYFAKAVACPLTYRFSFIAPRNAVEGVEPAREKWRGESHGEK